MDVEIIEESTAYLSEYARVPIAFLVTSRLRIEPIEGGLGGLRLVEEPVAAPYLKDFDAGDPPRRWSDRWDISHWPLLSAFLGSRRIGGAIIAWRTPGVNMLEGRDDLAVLWDIRVDPNYRGRGVGSELFARAFEWAGGKGCSLLKVEAQNINVPACRFYASQGCELRAICPGAYTDAPEEVQLLWYIDLNGAHGRPGPGAPGRDT